MYSTLRRAGGQAGDVIVHQERVDDQRRRGAEQRAGHDLTPVVTSPLISEVMMPTGSTSWSSEVVNASG